MAMKTALYRLAVPMILSAAVCCLSTTVAHAKRFPSQAQEVSEQAALRGMSVENMVDSLVNAFDFQFLPARLHGQVNGNYAIYKYENTPGFPLWLMINMGGPLFVDTQAFVVNQKEEKIKDGVKVWLVNASCSDSVNGSFDLQFVIEASTGKTAVNVTQTARGADPRAEEESPRNKDSFLFQGYIYPTGLIHTYKNAKEKQRALDNERLLDMIVPQFNFRIGGMTVTPKLLENQFARLVYLDKYNDIWYLRFEFPPDRYGRHKTPVLDMAINARTGESHSRSGTYDYLYKNWLYHRESAFTVSN